MTTHVQARDTIVSLIQPNWTATYPNVPIYYEDTTAISLDLLGTHFLLVSINFTDAIRQDIDPSPTTRLYGEISLRLFSKEGSGVRTTLGFMDYLASLLKYRLLNGVTLGVAMPGKRVSRDGWTSTDLNVEFSFWG